MTPNIPQELRTGLEPVRRRLWLKSFGVRVAQGVALGMGAALLLLLIARLVPMLHSVEWAAGLVVLGTLIGAGVGIWQRPTIWQAAAEVDRYGLKDRVSTALHFADHDSPIAHLQRQEAIEMLLGMRDEVPQIVPFQVSGRWLSLTLVLFVLLGALSITKNPMERVAEERQAAEEKADEIEAAAKKAMEEAKKQGTDPKQEAKLQETVEKLREELREAKTQEDVERALKKAQNKLQALKREQTEQGQDLQKLADALSKTEAGKSLADALTKQNAEVAGQALQDLKEKLEQLSPEQKAALADALAKAGQGAKTDAVSGLRQAAEALKNGDVSRAQNQLASLSDVMNSAMSSQGALNSLESALASAGGSMSSGSSPSGEAGQGTASSGGGSTDTEKNDGDANGAGKGQSGAGNAGAGAGAGNSSGSSGSGSGMGSGSGSGNGGTGSGAGGSGAGKGIGNRDLVMVPAGEFGVGETGNDGAGPKHSGPSQFSNAKGQVTPGVARPYQEVYREYESYARQSVERSDLPLGEQELVRDYFSEIAP